MFTPKEKLEMMKVNLLTLEHDLVKLRRLRHNQIELTRDDVMSVVEMENVVNTLKAQILLKNSLRNE